MAVNGIDLAVGQVWRTRCGPHAKVTAALHGSDVFSFVAVVDGQGKTYTAEGRTSLSGVSDYDLVRFVCLDDGRAPAIKFVGPEKSDGETWIKWAGGDCPVAGWQPVRARLRDGSLAFSSPAVVAGDLDWAQTDAPGDIVEYMALPINTPVTKVSTLAGFTTTAEHKKLADPRKDALDVQVGGDHYKSLKIQPIEFIHANDLDFFQGNIVKYAARHKSKGGAADLRKVIHYAQLALQMQYGEKA